MIASIELEIAAFAVPSLIAAGALIHSILVSRRQAEFERETQEVRKRDRLRACLRAEYRDDYLDGRREWKVYIVNDGPGTATDVTVNFDGCRQTRHEVVGADCDGIEKLGPKASYVYNTPRRVPLAVELSWLDEAGEPDEWKSNIS